MVNIKESYSLTWDLHSDHSKQMLQCCFASKSLSDVTLVSDDLKQLQAHKLVISSFSPVFNEIISKNAQNSIIYLRGIQHQELKAILEFMYLGETKVEFERMKDFVSVAESLQISGWKNIGDPSEVHQKLSLDGNENKQEELSAEPLLEETFNSEPEYTEDKLHETLDNVKKLTPKEPPAECKICHKVFTKVSTLRDHTRSVHEHIRYDCTQCHKVFSRKTVLNRHLRETCKGYLSGPDFESKEELGSPLFQCEMCKTVFVNKEKLTSHFIECHVNPK